MREDPNWKAEIAKFLEGASLPPAREAEIIDELAGHLSDDYHRLVASGANENEAREIAIEGLYDRPQIAEALRKVERMVPREPIALGAPRGSAAGSFWRDLRYTTRMLTRSPGFTALALLSLALGIGGNAAMFRILNAALIRPLPYANPDRLVQAANTGYYPPGGLVALQQESRTMELAGYSPGLELNLTGFGEPRRLRGSAVSANLFQVLGVGVELGRSFRPGEEEAGRDNLVILSHELWQDQFGGDRGIVGRIVMLGGVGRQVVGVAARGLAFPQSAAGFWIPLHFDPGDPTAYWAR